MQLVNLRRDLIWKNKILDITAVEQWNKLSLEKVEYP